MGDPPGASVDGDGGAEHPDGTLFGPYRLVELLGRGGMGEVWRAYDTRRERTVALKRLADGWADVPAFRQRFGLEARATARLNSEHVIVIHDYGEIDGQLFIDMRLVSGGDLSGLLAGFGSGLAPELAVDLGRQVADGLDAAHRAGLVHRDVKPSNVMLAPDTGGWRAYIVDFGIAKLADELGSGGLTATGATLGTPAYMAPELYAGSGDASVASDVYALGCVLFQMLTGRRVFLGSTATALMHQHLTQTPPTASSVRPELAPFDEVLARALAKDPRDRHPSAGALAAAAADALDAGSRTAVVVDDRPTEHRHPPAGAPAVDDPRSGRRWWRRRGPLAAVAAVVLVAIGVTAGITGTTSSGSAPAAPVAPVSAAPTPLPVSLRQPFGVAFTPDGRHAYIADGGRNTVAVLDTGTGTAVASIPVGLGPNGLAVSPDGRRVYVTDNGNDQQQARTVSVIDTATNAVSATVPVGDRPLGVVVDPSGRRVYVTNNGTNDVPGRSVSVIDTATDAVVATIPVGDAPSRPAISPDGSRVYVPSYGTTPAAGTSLTVIDTATNRTSTVPTGDAAPGRAISFPDGRHVLVACGGYIGTPGSLQILDVATGTSTPLGRNATSLAIRPDLSRDGRTVVAPNSGTDGALAGSVSIVDTVGGTNRTVVVGGQPTDAAISPDGGVALVTTDTPGGVWRIPLR